VNTRSRAYWSCTGLFCLALTGSGLGHLVRAEPIAAGMAHLGYPLYVSTMLGVAKLLGVAALLVAGRPLLKEWAYAGFAFNLLGATLSHAFAGDALPEVLPPALIGVVGAASYLLRPADRRLPQSASWGTAGGPAGPVAHASHG
jgi:hypothetical protein